MTVRGHTGTRYQSRDRCRSSDRSPSSDCSRSGKRSWQPGWSRRDCAEAVDASRNRGNSGLVVEPAHAAAGGSTALPTSSFPDLVRLVLSLSGYVDQRGAVLGSLLSAAAVTGAGGVPAPLQRCHQQPQSLACLRCPLQVRRLLLVQPLLLLRPVDVSVLRSLPAQINAVGGRLVGRGPVRVESVAGVSPVPLLALPVWPVYLLPLPLSPRIWRGGLVRCLLSPPVVLVLVCIPSRRVWPPPSWIR